MSEIKDLLQKMVNAAPGAAVQVSDEELKLSRTPEFQQALAEENAKRMAGQARTVLHDEILKNLPGSIMMATPEEIAKLKIMIAEREMALGSVNLPDNNPKTAAGAKKAQLHLVPASAIHAESYAFADGADKYGPYNWRKDGVTVSTYISAARRHLDDYFDGEDLVPDSKSGAHHLGAVRACMAILIDAKKYNMLNDDRPKNYAPQHDAHVNDWKWRTESAETQTTGPLSMGENELPIIDPCEPACVGDKVRLWGAEPLYTIERVDAPPVSPPGLPASRYSAKYLVSCPGLPDQMIHHRAIKEIVERASAPEKKSNYRCVHCPNDAAIGSTVCEECYSRTDG